ncbi:MAG: stress response translation initiation inhibitor YciH [Haloarculaceae archaeon]
MSKDLNDVTGLPSEVGVGDDLARAEQRVSIRVESRRYGKPMTIVEGIDPRAVDIDSLASTLKSRLAVGGTVTDGRIELQGDHGDRLPDVLRDEGYQVDD